MSDSSQENELSKSLVYFVSRRGANNFWAQVINGTTKVFTNDDGTLSVSLAPNYRYVLTCHLPFFEKCSPRMKLLVLVHECGHIVHSHIPRLFKLLGNTTDPFVRTAILSVFNWAADFATNDALVRLEPGFSEVHKIRDSNTGEFTFLLPEEWGLPKGKSMEEYVGLMLKDLPKFRQRVERMLQDLAKSMSEEGDGEGRGEGQGDGESQDQGGDPSEILGPNGKPARGRGKGRPRIDSIPGVPDRLIQQAMSEPETFEMLQKAFDKISGKAHRQWNKKAEEMTPEEAISASTKMQKHAKQLVKSASERVQRDRGTLPGGAQALIDKLMEPERLPWDLFLRDIIQGAISARVQEEMASPNLSLINEDFIEPWPGQTLEFGFNITWMTDTSGSMGDGEYARACAALNSLLAVNKSIHVTYVECDASLQKEVKVSNVEPPDEKYLAELRMRRGYGGTSYAPFFRRVLGVDRPNDWINNAPRLEDKHPKPDLIVVCTDGGVMLDRECFPQLRPDCPIIWLLMPGCSAPYGMDNVAPNRLVEMFRIKEDDA